ncbi:protein FAR1-RELATED SEQUENCE 9-like [Miscanthus floridulus]|uniref:protein FAR1-RELATED SEQUENCE 9-like n=1 Tax=Miscanthus floridulus TaxID=154761 RepID=UPI00345A2B08
MGKAISKVFTESYHGLCIFHIMQNAVKHLSSVKDKMEHFERTVEDKRAKEFKYEFEARKKIPRRQMHTPMLLQASEVYTPVIFEAFQGEYERSKAACSRLLDANKYGIAIGRFRGDLHFGEERIVIGDPLNQTASCSCGMFNRTGILCAHGLKVLDLMNIKILPTHYVLKRWTKAAHNGSVQDKEGRNVVANPKLESQLRYKNLSHKFLNLAYKVAQSLECCLVIQNALDCLGTQLEDKPNASTSTMRNPCNDQENVEPNVQQGDDLLSAAHLKKKEVNSKNSRRKKTWIDKLNKGKHKPTKKGAKNGDCNKGATVELQEYIVIDSLGSFTQLITTPTYDGGILNDHVLRWLTRACESPRLRLGGQLEMKQTPGSSEAQEIQVSHWS